jgi:hypothetical protein
LPVPLIHQSFSLSFPCLVLKVFVGERVGVEALV